MIQNIKLQVILFMYIRIYNCENRFTDDPYPFFFFDLFIGDHKKKWGSSIQRLSQYDSYHVHDTKY